MQIQDRDFFKEPFSEEELRSLIGSRPVSDVFAWRSPSFKALGRDPSSVTESEMISLMLQEPRLIRRPITRVGDELIIGSSERELARAVGG